MPANYSFQWLSRIFRKSRAFIGFGQTLKRAHTFGRGGGGLVQCHVKSESRWTNRTRMKVMAGAKVVFSENVILLGRQDSSMLDILVVSL